MPNQYSAFHFLIGPKCTRPGRNKMRFMVGPGRSTSIAGIVAVPMLLNLRSELIVH